MINRLSMRYGLILAVISLAISLLLYFTGVNIMAMGIIGIVWLIAMLILWIMFAIRVRKNNNNSFSLAEGFQSLFIIALFPLLTGVIWQMLLTNVIDPGYNERMMEETMTMMEGLGVTITDEMNEEMMSSFEESSSIVGQLKGTAINIAIMGVLALIVALIIKKEKNSTGSLDAM